jgi:hypothetical protein
VQDPGRRGSAPSGWSKTLRGTGGKVAVDQRSFRQVGCGCDRARSLRIKVKQHGRAREAKRTFGLLVPPIGHGGRCRELARCESAARPRSPKLPFSSLWLLIQYNGRPRPGGERQLLGSNFPRGNTRWLNIHSSHQGPSVFPCLLDHFLRSLGKSKSLRANEISDVALIQYLDLVYICRVIINTCLLIIIRQIGRSMLHH